MGDLTPESPILQAFSDRMQNMVYAVGDFLEEKWNQAMDAVDRKMDEVMDKLAGMLGGLLGKAGDTIKAPLQKSSPSPGLARSKQPVKEISSPAPQISQNVQKQVAALNLPSMVGGVSAATSCQAPHVPSVSQGRGGGGISMGL